MKDLAENAGKSLTKKALTKFTEFALSKTILIQLNTIINGINPLSIGASFGIASCISHFEKSEQKDALK